ncbi:MAG: class IIb bacteriocin, lactobin A/cerein 7B family [Bacteroidota bacterium]
MKTLNLEQMGVQEMDAVEMKEVDGGSFLLGVIIGAVITAIAIIVTDNGGVDPDCPQ